MLEIRNSIHRVLFLCWWSHSWPLGWYFLSKQKTNFKSFTYVQETVVSILAQKNNINLRGRKLLSLHFPLLLEARVFHSNVLCWWFDNQLQNLLSFISKQAEPEYKMLWKTILLFLIYKIISLKEPQFLIFYHRNFNVPFWYIIWKVKLTKLNKMLRTNFLSTKKSCENWLK